MIQVGQVLDKYELLDRVGQGGMAIVYRGIDRSLKRVVAVKVLHKHLADYQEARDRFQREAQAVAKLRHENIVEIFDYSAKDGEESYIVTEFIDGDTLKQAITARPIAFPELGAMIVLQVCRALAHAHAAAILHRDVKPENVMIRTDGVVKLMDFGISHMVDLERLTVTGQLLGSPAYMAPEHVEGRPLDFRTDVFAAGIVLYQLAVGKLPFEGKNPHEVLKRIAECRFVDPRQANPRIGNRLGRIILRAMAAQPNDRYPAITEMVSALEAYLDESGLPSDKVPAELARYFSAPASYETALEARLVDALTRAGQHKLDDDDRAGALDAFDRVLTMQPANAKVLAILDRINRRERLKKSAMIALCVAGVGVGAVFVHEQSKTAPPVPPIVDVPAHGTNGRVVAVSHDDPPPPRPREQLVAIVGDLHRDAGEPSSAGSGSANASAIAIGSAAAIAATEPHDVTIDVLANSEYRVAGGAWTKVTGHQFTVSVADQPLAVEIRNPQAELIQVAVERGARSLNPVQQFLPATLVPRCKIAGASVAIETSGWSLDVPWNVLFEKNAFSSKKSVAVTFTGPSGATDTQVVTAVAGQAQDVTCALR